jgi:hypothetical protein
MRPAIITRIVCCRVVASICLTMVLATPAGIVAQGLEDARLTPLRLIEEISVVVEDLSEDAVGVALTRDAIQIEAEQRLQKGGMRVNREEATQPALYFQVSVLCGSLTGGCAIDVSSAVIQDVLLAQGTTPIFKAKTWYMGQILLAPRALVEEQVRAVVKQQTDAFVNDVVAARQAQPAKPPPSRRSGTALGD